MIGIHELFQRQLMRLLHPQDFILRLVKKKLSDLGIHLNQAQLKAIRQQLKNAEPVISFKITDNQIAHATIKSESDLEQAIQAALNNLPSEAIEAIKKIGDRLPDMMVEVADSVSDVIFRLIRRTYRFGLRDRRNIQSAFEEDLYALWGKAINQLEVLLGLALEAGEKIRESVTEGDSLLTEKKWLVVSRLHARACQIVGEVIALLNSGYADGAQARWRSLHEVNVILSLICEHDDAVAEQYLMHDVIVEYKRTAHELELYPERSTEKGFMSYLDNLKDQKKQLIQIYGPLFSREYGWAVSALGDSHPSFREIEKRVNLSHLRPYYREASHNVHAGVRGTFSRLGLHPDTDDILLAGASDFGLASPGHLAALSLTQATVSLLSKTAIMDALVFMKVILRQQDIVGKEFWKGHRRIVKAYRLQSD